MSWDWNFSKPSIYCYTCIIRTNEFIIYKDDLGYQKYICKNCKNNNCGLYHSKLLEYPA